MSTHLHNSCMHIISYTFSMLSGKYDYEFMDYTIKVLRKCKEYGFKVFIDPHQDVVRFKIFL